MSIKYIQDDNGNFYTDENGNLLTVDVSGEGGGQMLYRHDITLYEYDDDFNVGITIINTSSEAIDTIESVKNAVGLGTTIIATGTCYNNSEGVVRSIRFFDNYMTLNYGFDSEYSDDYANFDVSINDTITEIGIAGGGSGSGTPLVETTYDELKALRNGGQLVAGQKYRITDYVCTTTQENTMSAMHPFDIIVEALSNNTLSENASAIQHGGSGGGSPQFKPEVLADSEGNLVEGAVVPSYYFFEDFNENTGEQEGYKSQDQFIAYTYLENNEGVVVPVIYKTDADGAINAPEEFDFPDTQDTFFYDGTMEVDGTTYDKWRKIELGGDTLIWDGDAKVWALTNVVVTNSGSASDLYFANCKLSSWEIKYSLDNDKTRFWWADDTVSIYTDDELWFYRTGTYEYDGTTYYKWETTDSNWSNNGSKFLLSESDLLNVGEFAHFYEDGIGLEYDYSSVFESAQYRGKGVIYYMKDEYNNECPYDFKNIQFKRDDTYYYTFSWVDENEAVNDLSILGNTTLFNDEGQISGCYGNKMGIVSLYRFGEYTDNPNKLTSVLNNNIFISKYEMEGGIFFGCFSNTFGDDCFSNTFGHNCDSNTFGDYFRNNTFGDYCNGNTFGDDCDSNTFGHNCFSNTFGHNCDSNTFGEFFHNNTLGNNCFSNTFGDYCNGNTLGNNCSLNTFGDTCSDNIVDSGVMSASPQPTTGTQAMYGVHIHYGVTGQFTVVRGANYAQDVRTANDVTITV